MSDAESPVRRVCVFCASSPGSDPAITEATIELGNLLVERDLELVYGGGAVGLMGLIADTVLEGGGQVTGVIPRNLFTGEVAHRGLTSLEEVDSMHVRKARMYELADAFIALPGGFGTLEELAETLTWNQIGLLQKPVGVLDVGGFWQPLLELLDAMVDKSILKPANREVLLSEASPTALLDALIAQDLTYVPKWIGDGEI
jgi:uncharacterized protein (TIGR00730 family)